MVQYGTLRALSELKKLSEMAKRSTGLELVELARMGDSRGYNSLQGLAPMDESQR